jgi:hypothetical protein
MDPNKKQRVGYLVWFQGLDMGEFFKQDIEVFSPYEANEATYSEVGSLWVKDTGKMTTTAVIESFSFEESYPKDPLTVTGQVNASGSDVRITIADDPTKVAPNIDVNVYNVYFEVVPAANTTYSLHFATSIQTKYVRNWGLKVGTNASAALPPG